jgi:hypothetical protein
MMSKKMKAIKYVGNTKRLRKWFGNALRAADFDLRLQDKEKGESWKESSLRYLYDRMILHMNNMGEQIVDGYTHGVDVQSVKVANYALMIATRVGTIEKEGGAKPEPFMRSEEVTFEVANNPTKYGGIDRFADSKNYLRILSEMDEKVREEFFGWYGGCNRFKIIDADCVGNRCFIVVEFWFEDHEDEEEAEEPVQVVTIPCEQCGSLICLDSKHVMWDHEERGLLHFCTSECLDAYQAKEDVDGCPQGVFRGVVDKDE